MSNLRNPGREAQFVDLSAEPMVSFRITGGARASFLSVLGSLDGCHKGSPTDLDKGFLQVLYILWRLLILGGL